MHVHLVNPSDLSFGTAVITPRWLYVLAAATPGRFGTPIIVDETLEPFDANAVHAGDVVGIGIHTANALRGYAVARQARAPRRVRRVRRHPRHAVPGRSPRARSGAQRRQRRRRSRLAARARRLRGRDAGRNVRRRPHRRRGVLGRAVGSPAGGPLHVGIGPDRTRLSQALLVLLGVANGRTEAATAAGRPRSSAKSWRFAARGSASFCLPTTTSIR